MTLQFRPVGRWSGQLVLVKDARCAPAKTVKPYYTNYKCCPDRSCGFCSSVRVCIMVFSVCVWCHNNTGRAVAKQSAEKVSAYERQSIRKHACAIEEKFSAPLRRALVGKDIVRNL